MDVVLRVAIMYVALMLAFQVLGKRELSRLSPFELVTLMLIPEIVSQALVGEAPLVEALAGVATLIVVVFVASVMKHRFAKLGQVLEPAPTVLVHRGKLRRDAMNRELIQPDELFGEMHKHGFQRLEEIEWAILESGGDISFVPRDAERSGNALHAAARQNEAL